jgi:PAS domain S-box-containing protein
MACYVIAAIFAYQWTIVGGLAVFWLNNGLVAAALLLLPTRKGLAVAGVGVLTDALCARHMGGAPWSQAALIAGLDLCEAWTAALLIRRVGGAALDLTRVRRFLRVILCGVLPATLLAGTTGSLISAALFGADFGSLWTAWAGGDFLGMAIGLPTVLIVARFRRFDRPRVLSRLASIGLVAALSILAIMPFCVSGPPVAFIIFPLFLLAAFWLTPPYSAVVVVLVAFMAAILTVGGHGPFAEFPVGKATIMLRLQAFLTCIAFTLFLAQAALAERARSQAQVLKALAKADAARARAEAAVRDLEESEFRFQLLADNAADVIARYRPDGYLAYMSPSARQLFGYEPEELIGSSAHWHIIHPECLPGVTEWLTALFAGDMENCTERFEFRVVTRSGEARWVEATGRAVRDPVTSCVLELHSIVRDVTCRKELEAELEARRVEAEAASVAKSQFLANMSHEIRTPLNGVIATADLLARSELGEHDRKLVQIIRSSGASLDRLLCDILDLARVEAGRVELELAPFHLAEAVRSVVALCSLRAQEKGLALEVEISAAADRAFEGDEVRVRQIVTNLVNNAVKFTAAGEVRIRVDAPAAGGVRIEVTDTGEGFDPELRDRLFDRFQQADGSITRRFGGTGLGLPISRELAEAMGGTLECDSTPGVGSRFWFEAPLSPATVVEETCATQPEESLQGRVLVVDDHPTNRTVAELILRDFGFDVDVAENGLEALEIVEGQAFSLILMDMQMPVMDGLTAVRRIRALEGERGLARTPILMLTANALPEHAAQSQAAGADGHVAKPITTAALAKAIFAVSEAEAVGDGPGARQA